MSDPKKSKEVKKHINGVAAPGTSAPPSTSKPAIVTNRPLLQDPMMAGPAPEADDSQKSEEAKPSVALSAAGRKSTIQPFDDGVTEEPEEGASEQPAVREPETSNDRPDEDSVPDEEPQPAGESEAPKQQTEIPPALSASPAELNQPDQSAPEAAPANEAAPPSADTSKQALAKQAEAEAAVESKHEAEIQELVVSKRYVLPIKTTEQRKSKHFVVLGAALAAVLIIIWLDIALDAGIIKLGGLKPLTHFFSN